MQKREQADTENVVERAISNVGGSPGELAKRLSKEMDEEVSRQRVNGWRGRGVFPKEVIVHVQKVTRIPLVDLISAKPVGRDAVNIVLKALRSVGKNATPASFAEELSKVAPKKVTRQMVNGWVVRGQFPQDMCVWVHVVTKLPVAQLLKRKS